ncbi:MAG: DUF3662 and FHA domain-containing protein [bacterium]|nr:DUF3662 and FHA domain-containing protein [bacterium]
MSIFDRFEGKMDDFMDNAAGSLFKSPIEPSQIAKKCEKQMHRNKLVGAGVQYAPTLYTVLVNIDDDERLFGFYPTMAGELETFLIGRAGEEGLALESRPLVRFIADERLKRGKFDVIAEVVDADIIDELREEEARYYGISTGSQRNEPSPRSQRASSYDRAPSYGSGSAYDRPQRSRANESYDVFDDLNQLRENMPAEPVFINPFEEDVEPPVMIPVAVPPVATPASPEPKQPGRQYGVQACCLMDARTGKVYPLDYDIVVLGRESTCDIVINDSSISREHAQFELDQMGNWIVYDLDSTNGTLVNNISVKQAKLRFGDQLTFGTTILQFRKG